MSIFRVRCWPACDPAENCESQNTDRIVANVMPPKPERNDAVAGHHEVQLDLPKPTVARRANAPKPGKCDTWWAAVK